MAGQPIKRRRHALLDEHEGEIWERLASGGAVTRLCDDLGLPSTHNFYTWLDAEEGRRELYDRVRKMGAAALAEESIALVDKAREEEPYITAAQASLVREQASGRRWLAGAIDPETFGAGKSDVNVNVSFGELHLDALRQAGRMATPDGEPEEIPEADYEMVEEGDGERVEKLGRKPDAGT